MSQSADPKYNMDIKVNGHKDDLTSLVAVLKTIQQLCSAGASRTIKIFIDGDGSASLKFDFGMTDVNGVEMSKEILEEYQFYIGE